MSRARLLIVTTTYYTQVAFLLPYARHFRSCGWRVDGLAKGGEENVDCRQAFERVWDMDWSRNPLSSGNLISAQTRVRAVVANGGYDLVHVHTPVAAFVTRFALRRRQDRPKVIYTAHGFHFYQGGSWMRNAVFRTLERIAGRWTDYLVVMNQEDHHAAKRYRIVSPDRVRFMPGIGIDLEQYRKGADAGDANRTRSSLKIGPGDTLFLVIAEFIPRKRNEDILRAFAALSDVRVHLMFAGSGPQLEPMRHLASNLGIGNRVHFLGFRRDIPALISAADAVILASSQEGLPRSLIEAYCLGTPCIGSDIRGIRDLITPESGLLFKVGDIGNLAASMRWVIEHPEESLALGAAGQRRVETYDLSRVIALHEALYQEALGETVGVGCQTQEATPVRGNCSEEEMRI